MQSIASLKATLREIDRAKYPELDGYTKADIWRDIGPGGLYLVAQLARQLDLHPGDRVLDLGCGAAVSSLFLARHYQAQVIAADRWSDLWSGPSGKARGSGGRGGPGRVSLVRLDAAQPLPFAEETFAAILCMNNLNFYGTDLAVIDRLARYLKPGGVFCAGGECLSAEFTPEQLAHPPEVYDFAPPVWQDDFLTSHSPGWWGAHIARSAGLALVSCQELEDGRRFYEEQALLSEPQGYFGLSPQQARELEIRQIEYGREHGPYMTIYQLVARRRRAEG